MVMHNIFEVGDKVVHRWIKKGYGVIVSMDEKGLAVEVDWILGTKKERSTEQWQSLGRPPLMYPGHHPTCNND